MQNPKKNKRTNKSKVVSLSILYEEHISDYDQILSLNHDPDNHCSLCIL